MKVFKYPLPIVDRQQLHLPRGAEIVHVGEQYGQVQLWALVDPAAPPEPVELCIAGTGRDWPDGYRYIGTVQPSYGLVWHVGEKNVVGASTTTVAPRSETIRPNE